MHSPVKCEPVSDVFVTVFMRHVTCNNIFLLGLYQFCFFQIQPELHLVRFVSINMAKAGAGFVTLLKYHKKRSVKH